MNETTISSGPSEWSRLILICIFVLILVFGIIANGFVLLSVLTNQINNARSSTNLLLINMSCADLFILVFNIFDIAQFSYDSQWPTAWYLGLPACKLVRFGQVLGCYVSVQTLFAISIERYISIVHPIKISRPTRRNRLYLIFIFIWSLGFLMALPNLYLLKLHSFARRPNHYICGLSDHWAHAQLIRVYKYTESIFFFFLPAFIQTVLYIIICHRIFRVDRAVQSQISSQINRSHSNLQSFDTKLSVCAATPLMNNHLSLAPTVLSQGSQTQVVTLKINRGNLARKKAIIMLLLIATFYFLSFSPAQISFIHTEIHKSHYLYEYRLFFVITILLALSSTAFNPILFYIFSTFFRGKFNLYLRWLCPCCRAVKQRQQNLPMA